MADKMDPQSLDLSEKAPAKPPSTFTSFFMLPPEIRRAIWFLTIESRTIEIQFDLAGGFYTREPAPPALQVCQESRCCILHLYPYWFGNHIYDRRINFNHKIDTLLLSSLIHPQIFHILASLSKKERKNLRYLAMTEEIDMNAVVPVFISSFDVMEATLPSLMGLRRFSMIWSVSEWHDDIEDEGGGPMQIYEKWPGHLLPDQPFPVYSCSVHKLRSNICVDEDHPADLIPANYNPESGYIFPTFEWFKIDTQWGWRPLKEED